MTDKELKLEIINKRKYRGIDQNTELILSPEYKNFIMECMEEWAVITSKRIKEDSRDEFTGLGDENY